MCDTIASTFFPVHIHHSSWESEVLTATLCKAWISHWRTAWNCVFIGQSVITLGWAKQDAFPWWYHRLLLRELACICGPEGYAGHIVREVLDKDALTLWAASWAWGDVPRKNSIISKPQQFWRAWPEHEPKCHRRRGGRGRRRIRWWWRW